MARLSGETAMEDGIRFIAPPSEGPSFLLASDFSVPSLSCFPLQILPKAMHGKWFFSPQAIMPLSFHWEATCRPEKHRTISKRR